MGWFFMLRVCNIRSREKSSYSQKALKEVMVNGCSTILRVILIPKAGNSTYIKTGNITYTQKVELNVNLRLK